MIIKYGEFEIICQKRRTKYLRLKITNTGQIKLTTPLNSTKTQILNFITTHAHWIKTTLTKIPKSDPNLLNFLGKSYKIEILSEFKITDETIQTPNLEIFYAYANATLKQLITQYIALYAPKINRPIHAVRIKNMTTRWGSCNNQKGYLNFSSNLAQKDPRFIEYVVLHELAHLIYPHHKSEFYDFISELMPDFKSRLYL